MANAIVKGCMLTVGVGCAGLGAYGAFELQQRLEGGVSYLVFAAPLISGAAAIIPYFAEHAWRQKQRVKTLLWWLTLGPAAAVVFFGAAERVHAVKAEAAAERSAYHSAAVRAAQSLSEAKDKATRAEQDVKEARKLGAKKCDANCIDKWEVEAIRTRVRVAQAQGAITAAETRAVEDSPLKAPVWLLPAALDLLAFMAIWCGLPVSKPPMAPVPPKKKSKKRSKAATPKKTPPPKPPKSLLHVVGSV